MSLNLFRRLDRYDQRIRQLERSEPPEGGGGGGDHVDSDHADAFSPLAHVHVVPLDSLSDVATAGADPNEVLTWNGSSWVPAAIPAGGSLALDDLTDVSAGSPVNNEILTYDGSSHLWAPSPLTSHDADHSDAFSALTHLHTGVYAPVEHDTTHDDRFSLLAHVHTGVYAPLEHDSAHDDRFALLAHTHAAHADSDHDDRFSLLAHVHDWTSITGKPSTFTPTPQALDWLTDVATAGQASTNVLTYNGSSWVPAAVPAQTWTSITGKPSTFPPDEHDTAHDDRFSLLAHTHAAHADSDHDDRFSLLAHLHTGTYAAVEHDSAHSDAFAALAAAVPAGGTTGQVLVKASAAPYDAGWSSSGPPPTAQPLDWLSDVVISSTPTTWNTLLYNGTQWVDSVREIRTMPNNATAPSGWVEGHTSGTVTTGGGYPVSGHLLSVLYTGGSGGFQILTETDTPFRVYHRAADNTTTWSAWTPIPVPATWQTSISYGSGWAASTTGGDQAPRYRLEGDTVRLDGSATRTSGTNTTMFTLPSGYRPVTLSRFWVPLGGSASGRIGIQSSGVVEQTAGTDFSRTTLDGISFPIT